MAYYKSERLQTRTMTQTTSSSGENFSGNAFNAKNGKITSSNTAERSTIDNTSLFQDSSSKLNRAAALPFIEHGGRILRSSIEKQYIFERKAVSEKQIELSGRSTTKTLLAKKKDVEKLGINPTKVKKSSDTNYKSQTLQPLPNKLVNKRKISSVDGSVNIKQRRIHEVPLIDIKYNTNFNKEIDYSVQNISDASMSFVEEEPTARENNVIAVDDYLAEDLLRNKLNDKLCEEDYAVEQFSDRKVINYCYYYKVKLMGNEKETYVNLLDIEMDLAEKLNTHFDKLKMKNRNTKKNPPLPKKVIRMEKSKNETTYTFQMNDYSEQVISLKDLKQPYLCLAFDETFKDETL